MYAEMSGSNIAKYVNNSFNPFQFVVLCLISFQYWQSFAIDSLGLC